MIYKLIPLFVAILLSTSAVAEEPKQMQKKEATFKSLDRNADERLSKSEVKNDAALSAHFAALDTDRDGHLTMGEYAAHTEPVAPRE
jgi:Ca2+-binding EF-hand superfamily protein